MGGAITYLPVFKKCSGFLTMSYWRDFVDRSLIEFNVVKDMLKL